MLQEHEILNAWLTDLGFEEYYDLFVQSGYDMHTITRMTPEVSINLNYVTQSCHSMMSLNDVTTPSCVKINSKKNSPGPETSR